MSEALNIIKAHFGSLREVTTAPVWQYNYGQKLEIDGIPNLPSTFEIHYSNSKSRGTAKRWIGYNGVVDVLDEYFRSGADIWGFIFLHEGEDDGETEYVIHIPVKERSEAEDSEPTPVQRDIVDEAIAALNAAVAQCGAYVEHYPTVINGEWCVWDEAQQTFVTTGVPATGNGIADARLNNDYTLTLIFTDGSSFTTPISIRGAQGEKGDTGAVPDFSIGTVTTLSAGSAASASITGTQEQPVLNLSIPQGQDGAITNLDTTLTVAGKAADAKAVGDALDGMPHNVDSTKTGVDLDVSDENGNVIVRLKDGNIQTKNFKSEIAAETKDSTKTGVDLDVSDPSGNILVRLQNGHIKTKRFDSSNAGNALCYVSPNGLDTNEGDSTHPFLTIQHAIDSGYNRIMLAPGEYKNQKVTINGKHGISIICNTNQKENNIFESHKRQARAKLDNSIDITGLTAYNSIFKTALSVDTDSSYYKVFVSKEVDPEYSGAAYYGRVTTYNAILWEITDDILTCTRLVPKLSLAECEATAGTFFYDGTDLYINPTSGSITGVTYKRLNDDTFSSLTRGFYIYNSTDIYIEGLDVQFFPYYDFHANLVSGLIMRDCGFYFTCYGSAAEFNNCNGDLWECNAAKAGADGFGIASGGNTSFYNCNAVYCYDDGISHHDEATGVIDGGIWTYCKKGGVTPSFGSHVTVKNVVATHNIYGIYITQSGERITDGVQYIQNCLAVDNTTKDIKITGYDVVAHGCSYRTKEVDAGATLTEYNDTTIA